MDQFQGKDKSVIIYSCTRRDDDGRTVKVFINDLNRSYKQKESMVNTINFFYYYFTFYGIYSYGNFPGGNLMHMPFYTFLYCFRDYFFYW